jgi:hypothetical protein
MALRLFFAGVSVRQYDTTFLKRQKDVMVVGGDAEREERRYSNGEINRELTTLSEPSTWHGRTAS